MKRFLIYVDQKAEGTLKGTMGVIPNKLGAIWKTVEVDAVDEVEAVKELKDSDLFEEENESIRETFDITKEHIEANPEWEASFK